MLKLKLQYFGHLMQRADLFEKTLMLGKIEGGRRRERLPTPVFWLGEFQELYSSWGHKESDMAERLSPSLVPWKKSYDQPGQHIKK